MSLIAVYNSEMMQEEIHRLQDLFLEKSRRVVQLETELAAQKAENEILKADNQTLSTLNSQFVRENISLRRKMFLDKRMERRRACQKGEDS